MHYAKHRQREKGQALIYGLFVLTGGLAALFFMFNTGQLVEEKTKLVNTADAVAYSAGVLHARALNFDAYTNRALMANEVMIAQAVSIASWAKYIDKHAQNVWPLSCDEYYSVPFWRDVLKYAALCLILTGVQGQTSDVSDDVQDAAGDTIRFSEAAKAALQGAQLNMAISLVPARFLLLQQVADANYKNDGQVKVDTIPITDNFVVFEGEPFIKSYSGEERTRFKEATVTAVNKDAFIKERSWTDSNTVVGCDGRAQFRRRGGTEMIGFDEWKALDTASWHEWHWRFHGFPPRPSCDDEELPLGYGKAAASTSSEPDDSGARYGGSRSDNPTASSMASGNKWNYSGLPTFYDLSAPGLSFQTPETSPRLKFAIRLTRAKTQTKTADGRSLIKPAGRLALTDGKQVADVLAAVATSEVFFERPVKRTDGKNELASLFNPFWQVHLISTSTADLALAMVMGGSR